MGRVGERHLIAQGGFPGAGGAGDQVGAAHRQSTVQDLIETGNPGWVLRQDDGSARLRVACDLRRSGSCHLVPSPCPRALAPALHALGEDALACSMPRIMTGRRCTATGTLAQLMVGKALLLVVRERLSSAVDARWGNLVAVARA